MSKFKIPETTFTSHPEGEHIGTILDVFEREMDETPFGQQCIVSVEIESKTAIGNDGKPLFLLVDTVLSSNPKSRFFKLRRDLLRRPLTEEERLEFDPNREMIGRKVSYLVEHGYRDDGTLFPRLVTWSPVGEAPPGKSVQDQAPAARADDAGTPFEYEETCFKLPRELEAVEDSDLVLTHDELIQIAKYWALEELQISWFWFVYAQSSSSESRRRSLALHRLSRIADCVGKDTVEEVVDEVWEEFRRDKDAHAWEVFQHGDADERRKFQDQVQQEIEEVKVKPRVGHAGPIDETAIGNDGESADRAGTESFNL